MTLHFGKGRGYGHINRMPQGAAPHGFSLSFTSGSLPSGVALTRSSTARYLNSSGVLTSGAVDTARFDYLVNSAYAGGTAALLVEPAATNVVLQSEAFNATWSAYQTTVTADAITAPDGSATADKIVSNGANDAHGANQQPTAAAGTYSMSVWLKAAGYNFGYVSVNADGGVNGYAVVVNLTTGAVTATNTAASPTSTSYAVETHPNGWYRLRVTCGHSSGNISIIIGASSTGTPAAWAYNCPSYAGDGTSGVYMWGAQLELGSVQTAYVTTTGGSASRSADVATFTVPSGVSTLRYTFDDGSTQDVSVSPGAYTVPTNLNRARIRTIVGS